MAGIEILSAVPPAEFAEDWYDMAGDEHFWIRWRFEVLLHEIGKLGLDIASPLRGLDIGCGHGAMQRQLGSRTAWHVDGCDLNKTALSLNSGHPGRVLYYDINDRQPEFREQYDFLILFDVLEHIESTTTFIESATYHLKPGGYAFVNVPALQFLYSKYDKAVGHIRRYDQSLLRRHLTEGGLEVCSTRYWGMLLLPIAVARKLYVDRITPSAGVVRAGFESPHRSITRLLLVLEMVERRFFRQQPLGTSLLSIARKPLA